MHLEASPTRAVDGPADEAEQAADLALQGRPRTRERRPGDPRGSSCPRRGVSVGATEPAPPAVGVVRHSLGALLRCRARRPSTTTGGLATRGTASTTSSGHRDHAWRLS